MVVKAAINFLNQYHPQAIANQTDVITTALNDPEAKKVYVQPVPAVSTVETTNGGLKTALLDYQTAGGGKQLAAAVAARTVEVSSLVRQLAAYVTSTADGDMEKLRLSGFPIQKPTRQKVGKLAAPDAPYLKQGVNSGEIDASVTAVYGASTYNWRVALVSKPDVFVQTAQTTGSRTTLGGLEPGEVYLVQANAVGAAGPSDWSDSAQLMVV